MNVTSGVINSITSSFVSASGSLQTNLAPITNSNKWVVTGSLSQPSLNTALVISQSTTYGATNWNTAIDTNIVQGPKTNTTSYPNGETFFVINRSVNTNQLGYILTRFNGSTDRGAMFSENRVARTPWQQIGAYDFGVSSPQLQYFETLDSANQILTRVNSSAVRTIYRGSTQIATNSGGNDTQARTFRQFHNIGRFGTSLSSNAEQPPIGTMYCELIQYNRVLTTDERNNVWNYLSNKWNIPIVVTNNLSLYYDAGIPSSYPGSGTSWFNIQPTTLTSTLTNGPTFSTNNGGTIVFDGTNDYTTRAAATEFVFGTGDFTVEAWVKIVGNSSQNNDGTRDAQVASSFPDSGGDINNSWGLQINGNSTTTGTGLSFGCRNSTGTFQRPTINYTFTQGVFYQIGITHRSGVTNFFINGVLYAASINLTNDINNTTRPFKLGGLIYPGYTQYLNGTIGLVRIYKGTGLTASEVLQNYNANSNRI